MKLKTKLKILTSIFVLIRSMRQMVKGLKETSTMLIVATSALVTLAAFVLTPRITQEIKARRALS